MSIIEAVTAKGSNKLVIPCAGKMFRSSIENDDKALCFVLNKGYFETSDLVGMLTILDDCTKFKEIILVGQIEKVRLRSNKSIVYRQRIFFKNLKTTLNLCRVLGLRFELSPDFHISINNIMNCRDELTYLERYARRFDETIDEWLTHCCIIEMYYLLKSLDMYSDLGKKANIYLRNRVDYLHRAPFLISSYSIENKSSGIFLGFQADDKRLYKEVVTGKDLLKLGYTVKNVEKDIKEGKFNENKVN